MDLKRRIETSLGQRAADLVITDCQIVNVMTGEIYPGDLAIAGDTIAAIGRGLGERQRALGGPVAHFPGCYLLPGLINAHCHVESSMVEPRRYCRAEVSRGVTTLVTDPHEIANVAGLAGVDYMLQAAAGAPVNYFTMLPSCVPATPFEQAGAHLVAADLLGHKNRDRVLGLGELMNFPGLLAGEEGVLAMAQGFADGVIDGHFPGGTGAPLQAYVAAGVATDHESTSWAEAWEKLRAGLAVLVRQGSASQNLDDIIGGLLQNPGVDTRRMAFCTDDKHLADLLGEGSILYCLRRSVALGLAPITAIQMATLNAAQIYHLPQVGALAPGKLADLLVVGNLKKFPIEAVFKSGAQVAGKGGDVRGFLPPEEPLHQEGPLCQSVHLPPLSERSFALPQRAEYPVIGLVEGQITTQHLTYTPEQVRQGLAAGSLCQVAVVERHHATGAIGLGLLAGYGLQRGAVATTVAHDSHNLIVAGSDPEQMLRAAQEIARIQGGYALVGQNQVVGSLPLPLAGLMSLETTEAFLPALEKMLTLAQGLGVAPGIDPFITLSFIALPVIPALRLTDQGIFDVERFSLLP